MKHVQYLLASYIILGQPVDNRSVADETSNNIDQLKRENEELNRKIKGLQEEEEARFKKLEQELDQRIKIVDRKRELDTEASEAKAKESSSIFKLPEWITGIRLLNDFRARYDGIYAPDSDFVSRQRARFRLRLGAITTIKNDFDLGVRLASAPSVGGDTGGDPVSTNATLENNASRKPIGVDWAFARWSPIHGGKLTSAFAFGKMENPPNYSEMVFDIDYTPEGFSEQLSYEFNNNHALSAYLGQYFLDELQFSTKDPFLFLEQLRLDSILTGRISTSFGVSGLSITNPQTLTTTSVPDSNHGNTRDSSGALINDYQLVIADAAVTYTIERVSLYNGRFPIKLSAEYIHNFGADHNNSAYAFGRTFGKSGKKGTWEMSYRYQELQADANYEELTASDYGAFYRGRPAGEPATLRVPTFLNGVNVRGHTFRLSYSPYDFLTIFGNLWLTEAINEVPKGDRIEGVRVIVDAVFRF